MESKLQAKRVLEIGSFCGVGISPASTITGVSGFNHQKYELFLGFKMLFWGLKFFLVDSTMKLSIQPWDSQKWGVRKSIFWFRRFRDRDEHSGINNRDTCGVWPHIIL